MFEVGKEGSDLFYNHLETFFASFPRNIFKIVNLGGNV